MKNARDRGVEPVFINVDAIVVYHDGKCECAKEIISQASYFYNIFYHEGLKVILHHNKILLEKSSDIKNHDVIIIHENSPCSDINAFISETVSVCRYKKFERIMVVSCSRNIKKLEEEIDKGFAVLQMKKFLSKSAFTENEIKCPKEKRWYSGIVHLLKNSVNKIIPRLVGQY